MGAEISERAAYVAAHPWRWRLGWFPWQLTAAWFVLVLVEVARARQSRAAPIRG